MKRIIPILSIVLLILLGCSEKEDAVSDKTEEDVIDVETEEIVVSKELIQKLNTHAEGFLFVADWLSDEEILFVEKEEDIYFVKSFNVYSGEVNILYEDSTIIVDVLVHPSKEKILIHTTDSPSSATVKIISLNGFVEHEITVESSELEIEWNDINPSLVLFTAFYDDWTYDVFFYDGHTDNFHLITLDDPFPKWLGTKKIIVSKSSDEGEKLYLHDLLSDEDHYSGFNDVVHYDTYQDVFIIGQMVEGEEMKFSLVSEDLLVLSNWVIPAPHINGEWLVPEIDWQSKELLMISSAQMEGKQVFSNGFYRLIKVDKATPKVLVEKVPEGPVSCSPSGNLCLVGFAFDRLIDIENKEQIEWILLED